MARPWRHSPRYHAWSASTPVIDVVATVLAFASVLIGAHAALFLAIALSIRDTPTAIESSMFFVAIALANGALEIVRHWRRHHA
jgi:hypothetical protein